jgi:hypothetical protein
MKNKDFLWKFMIFFVGVGVGVVGFWAIDALIFTPGPLPVTDCATKISVDVAHKYSQDYLDRVTTPTEKIKGFTVDNCMINTMNSMLSTNPTPAGFRIYLGHNGSDPCWIICGLDQGGADITGTIFNGKANNAGLCPTLCDGTSPIPGR